VQTWSVSGSFQQSASAASVKQAMSTPTISSLNATAGRFPSLRDAMLLDAPLQYWRILAAIRDAVLNEDRLEIYDLDDTGNAVKAAFVDANRAQAHWLTHRLL
jgi:hypothetical protein